MPSICSIYKGLKLFSIVLIYREFIDAQTLKVHTIQPDMYPKQMISFIEEQAKVLSLEIRKINGVRNFILMCPRRAATV